MNWNTLAAFVVLLIAQQSVESHDAILTGYKAEECYDFLRRTSDLITEYNYTRKSMWRGIIGNEAFYKKQLEASYGVTDDVRTAVDMFLSSISDRVLHNRGGKSDAEHHKTIAEDFDASGVTSSIRMMNSNEMAIDQREEEEKRANEEANRDIKSQKREKPVKWSEDVDENLGKIIAAGEMTPEEIAAIKKHDLVPDGEKVSPDIRAKEIVFDAMERKIFIALKSAILNMDIDLKKCKKSANEAAPVHSRKKEEKKAEEQFEKDKVETPRRSARPPTRSDDEKPKSEAPPTSQSQHDSVYAKARKYIKIDIDPSKRKHHHYSDNPEHRQLQILRDALIHMASDIAEEFEISELPSYYDAVERALRNKRGLKLEEALEMRERCRLTHFQVQVFIESFFKHVEDTLGCELKRKSTKVAGAAESKTLYAFNSSSQKMKNHLEHGGKAADIGLEEMRDNTIIDLTYNYFRAELYVRYQSKLMELFNNGRSLFFLANEIMYDLEEIGTDFKKGQVRTLKNIAQIIKDMYKPLVAYPDKPKDLSEEFEAYQEAMQKIESPTADEATVGSSE